MRNLPLTLALATAFYAGALWAEESEFRALREASPFTRSLDIPKTLVLTGVADVDGKPIATIIDVQARRPMMISETPNALGWKLVEIRKMDDLQAAVAIIETEEGGTMRAYHDEDLIQEVKQQLRFDGGQRAHQLGANFLPDWVHQLEDPKLKGLAIQSFIEGGGFDGALFQAVDMALAVPEQQARGPAVSAAFGRLGGGVDGINITDAVNRLNAIPRGRDRDFAINGLAHGLVGRDPEGALRWARSIDNEGFRNVVVRNVSRRIEERAGR